ncbi:type VII secretion target [Saccharopolyspora sp. NPDC002376]
MVEPKDSGTARFSVEPAELRDAAQTVQEAIGEFSAQSALKYWLNPGEVGNGQLAKELSEFQRNSSGVVDLLRDDALEMAERLADAAAGYERTDSDMALALSDVMERQ